MMIKKESHEVVITHDGYLLELEDNIDQDELSPEEIPVRELSERKKKRRKKEKKKVSFAIPGSNSSESQEEEEEGGEEKAAEEEAQQDDETTSYPLLFWECGDLGGAAAQRQRSSSQKLVSFDAEAYMTTTLHHKDYSREEREKCWYTKAEIFRRRKESQPIVLYMRRNNSGRGGVEEEKVEEEEAETEVTNNDEIYCTRGLEHRIHDRASERKKNREDAWRAVLDEQCTQSILGFHNVYTIADRYIFVSRRCAIQAYRVGQMDENDAFHSNVNDNEDINDLSSSFLKKKEEKHQSAEDRSTNTIVTATTNKLNTLVSTITNSLKNTTDSLRNATTIIQNVNIVINNNGGSSYGSSSRGKLNRLSTINFPNFKTKQLTLMTDHKNNKEASTTSEKKKYNKSSPRSSHIHYPLPTVSSLFPSRG